MTAAVLYCSEGMGKFSLKEGILIGEFTASCVSRAINNIQNQLIVLQLTVLRFTVQAPMSLLFNPLLIQLA